MGEQATENVEITLKRIGPGRPTRIRVPTPLRVDQLKSIVAAESSLPAEDLKLVLRGRTLCDQGIMGEDITVKLKDGDSLIVAVIPKPPAKYFREGLDDDDEELKFRIPDDMSRRKKRILLFLQKKLKFPDFLLMVMLSISLKAWLGIILWFILAPVAQRWDMGPLFILGTGFTVILMNLGKRQDGDVSAYSIFNEDFRELPGTLNADRLDRDIRAGQF
ncbi:ubiquitin family protein [Wolffia australiana]